MGFQHGPLWRWISLLLLAGGAQCVAAQTGTANIGNNDSYVLSRAFTFFEDTSTRLSLDDILQSATQSRFKPVSQSSTSTNFGPTQSAIWLRVQLQTEADAPTRWMLEVANPPLDRLDLYVSNAKGGYDHQSGGDYLPFDQRSVAHRNHVKPISLVPGTESTLYLRVVSQGTVSVPTALWQPRALWQSDQKTYSVFSLYFGQLLGLVFYNLMLFLSVRDRAYLLYVVFVACVGLSQVASSGLGPQFVWPQVLWLNDIATNTAYAGSGVFGLMFVRNFLASKAKMPRLDRIMQVGIGMWAVATCLIPFLGHRPVVVIVTGLALGSALTVVCAGALSIYRRHPGAKYFGFAWLALILGILTLTAHNYGLLPSNLFTTNAMLIGSALEMVLLSFALADRINVARRERELALARVMSERAMVQALQQSQERYRAVIEHIGEGMVVVQNERIVFVNFRATEILDATKSEIIEDGLLQRIHADDRAALNERIRLRLMGEVLPDEHHQVRLELPGQDTKWLEFGDNLVPWDGGQGLLVFFLDVTQRHNAELETRAAVERQQRLNDLRSRFIAMTSHEFRTPLATILSAQDLLQSYSDRLPQDEKLELYDMIRAGVNRMTRMLERILLLGQAEAHMLECKPQDIDLAALCAELVAEAKTQQPASRCEVFVDCAPELHDRQFDDTLLRHIFGNLLSNAIKYSPVGGQVRLKVCAQGTQTVFEVSDQGIGIPHDEIEDLFESFHRASNVGDIQGTGLGLAIVKQAVDLHGGTVQVHSTVGQGTRFTVRLHPGFR
nr:7TM diverse intracellular signaling domain-containing protein [Rhodoferax sp.]